MTQTSGLSRRMNIRKIPQFFIRIGHRIRHFSTTQPQILTSFFIPAMILFVSYMCFGVFPAGRQSVLSLDLNGQYVYYYDYMYDVFAGKESLFYSWSRNMSGEFMGIIGYYLASPFNFIVWMFPRSLITEGLLTMMVVKVGAIGACAAIYFTYAKKYSHFTTILFSSMYALCSYTIVQTMNPMWLDGVMVLPLIMFGIEKLIEEGRFRLLIGSLVYAFVTCFYIGFMLAIFTAMYYVYYIIVCEPERRGDVYTMVKRAGLFAISALTAAMISAFMLLPVYHALSYGKFTFSNPDFSPRTNFPLIELLDKLIPNSYDTVRMSGLPFLYAGTLSILLVPVYFFLRKINLKERIATGYLLLILVFCMYFTPIDMLWHGGQMPNWLPYRYSFIVSFLIVVMGAKAFENIQETSQRTIGIVTTVFLGILVYLEQADNFVPDLGKNGRDTLDSLTVVLPAIAIFSIIGVLLVLYRNNPKTKSRQALLLVIICMELIYNTLGGIMKQNVDIVYSTRDSYRDVILPTREVVEKIKAEDDGFYRIEKNYFRTVNDPMALNMYGLSHSSSMLNDKPIDFLGKLGLTSRSHYTRYSGATPLVDDLLSVKYILSTSTNKISDLMAHEEISVEVNENALPMAYLTSTDVRNLMLLNKEPFENQNKLLSAMLGEEYTSYFIEQDEGEVITENVRKGNTTDGHISFHQITKDINTQISYDITLNTTGELFMYLPTSYERTVNVWVNKEFLGVYFETDNYHVKSLGHFENGETVNVILTLTKENLYFKDAKFMVLNTQKLEESIAKLQERNKNTVVEKLSPTHIRVQTNSDQGGMLFTSIPDEKGWKLYVDGVETEYSPVLANTLIAVDLPSGAHTVELKFTTAGYPLALLISAAGIVIFVVMILIWRKKFNKRNIDV